MRNTEPLLSKDEMIERDRRICFDLIADAIRTGDLTVNRSEIQAAIDRCAQWADSGNRLAAILGPLEEIAAHSSPAVAGSYIYPTIFDWWSICDNTHGDLPRLLTLLQYSKDHRWESLPSAARRAYDRLPEKLTIFRGCSRDRVYGISWTRSRKIAKSFAEGHRGIRVPNPVVVTAMVDKSDVFFMRHSRRERECLVAPEGLQIVSIRTFVPKALSAFEVETAKHLFGGAS